MLYTLIKLFLFDIYIKLYPSVLSSQSKKKNYNSYFIAVS